MSTASQDPAVQFVRIVFDGAMRLACNCYGPHSDHQPDLLWDLDLYRRLARADAWAFIGPINWYGQTSNLKLLFDRLVCLNGGNPRPDLIEKKNTVLAQALEQSPRMGGAFEEPSGRAVGRFLLLRRSRRGRSRS